MATDWAAARLAFVTRGATYKDIAERFGTTEAAARQRASREKWAEAKRAAQTAVTQAATEQIVDVVVNTLVEFNEADLKVARALRGQVAAHLRRAQDARAVIQPEKLRALASTAETAQRIGRLALGASTENAAVTAHVTHAADLSQLCDADLETLEQLLTKASPPRLPAP